MTKIAELPIEERRLYNRTVKKKSRLKLEAKAEAERLAKVIPPAHKYVMPEAHTKQLGRALAQLMTAVQSELAELTAQDIYIIELVSDTVTGMQNKFERSVYGPEGILVGGHFPEAAGSEVIEHVHKYPNLLKSATFAAMYSKFLTIVLKWSKLTKNQYYISPECVRDIQQELDGTYKLPEPKPKTPAPDREPQPPQPVIDMSGLKLSEQLAGDYSQFERSGHSDMAQEAQQYLNHGKLNRNRF